MEICLTEPCSLSPCCHLCTVQEGQVCLCEGHSSDGHAPVMSSSLDSTSYACLIIPSAVLAGCWGHGFVFALAAGWDPVCSGAGGHRLLVHRRDVCPEKCPGFQRSTSITISLLGHRCASGENSAFWCHLLSPYSSSCADVHPRVASQGKLILFLVNADFRRERPVILWHQVHLSPRPYTAHLHSGPEGTDNLNFKWKIGTDLSLAYLGFRKNIWKQRQLVLKGSLGRGGKYL